MSQYSSLNLLEQLNSSFTLYSKKIAVEEEGEQYTYNDLKNNVYHLAETLNKLKVEYVAVIGEPSFLSVISVLATAFSRCIYIPLDPSWPINRIQTIIRNCNVQVIISSLPAEEERMDFSSLSVPYFVHVQKKENSKKPILSKETQFISFTLFSCKDSYDLPKKESHNIFYIMHTSGSSGEPKGVTVSLKAFHWFLNWVKRELKITHKDRFAYTSSLGFGASLRQIFSPLLSGSTIVCFHSLALKSPIALLKSLREKQITIFNVPPVLLKKTAQAIPLLPEKERSLPSIRLVLVGGDIFPTETLKKWFEHFQHDHIVVNLYGSTESIVNASFYKTTPCSIPQGHSFLPVGKPRPGLSFLILDENNNPITEENKTGALFIDSSMISSGYHKNREETKRVFSIIKGKPLYNTGDRAMRLPSKDYLVLGRHQDRQVQIYGHRVELSEIEHQLNKHPQVQRAFVVNIKNEDWHGIFAYIQPVSTKGESDFSFLREYLKEFLPHYMIPYDFETIKQVDETSAQKVDYTVLKQKAERKYLSFKKEKTQTLDSHIVLQVKEIWLQYLNKKDIDVHQSFFDAGGDSVMAVEVYQNLCEQFEIHLDPFVFYKSPTIYKLSEAIIEAQNKPAFPDQKTQIFSASPAFLHKKYKFSFKKISLKMTLKIFKIGNRIRSWFYWSRNTKTAPQSPQQKYFIYIRQLLKDQYNGCFSVPLMGPVDLEQLKKALDLIVNSQEALRTVFIGDRQIVLNKCSTDILFYDLSHEDCEAQKRTISEINKKLLYKNFDFSTLPLFKVALFKKSNTGFVLSVYVSHIVLDGWSLQIFLSHLNKAYGFLQNKASFIRPTSYIEYTLKYKSFCRKRYAVNKAFWESKFLKVERSNMSPKMQESDSHSQEARLVLGALEKKAVKESTEKYNTSSFYIFMALWARSFSKLIDCSKISFFITYHNRSFAFKGLQNMIGSVARMAPLSMDIPTENSFENVLKQTRKVYLEVLNYCDFNVFSPGRNDNYSIVAFNYLDFSGLSQSLNHLPFKMDINQIEVHLSRSQRGHKHIHLFLSVHEYLNHIHLQVYGKAPNEHKRFLLDSIKNEISVI